MKPIPTLKWLVWMGLFGAVSLARAADATPRDTSVTISTGDVTNAVLEPAPAPPLVKTAVSHVSKTESPLASPRAPLADLEMPPGDAPYNQLVLDAIAGMPKGGGYSTARQAIDNLRHAVSLSDPAQPPLLHVAVAGAQPSFCSEATYLVLVQVYARLVREARLPLARGDLEKMLVRGQLDGEGVWGRWNANGPGTARLFYQLKLGDNFDDLARARPGDFMKIFWNDDIGFKEKGHSVVFLGRKDSPQGPLIQIWSSNLDTGYSEKDVPLSKIHRFIFSRLLDPGAIVNAASIPAKDAYLAGLLTTGSSPEDMRAKIGLPAIAADKPLLKAVSLSRPPEVRLAPPPADPHTPLKPDSAAVPGTRRALPVLPDLNSAGK